MQQGEQDKKHEMTQGKSRKMLGVAGKIIPLEILERTNEVKKIGEADKIIREEKKAPTCWKRVEMLEMMAWYCVPTIYIIFSVTYFTIHCMF